jgi:hypothetical protein
MLRSGTSIDEPLITDMIPLLPLLWSVIWCTLLSCILLHSIFLPRGSATCSTLPHPGVAVAADLLAWTVGVVCFAFAIMGSAAWNLTIGEMDLNSCPEYDFEGEMYYWCLPVYREIARLEVAALSTMGISMYVSFLYFFGYSTYFLYSKLSAPS